MPVLNTLINQLPIKIANSFVAHFILKTNIKNAAKYFNDVKLKFSDTLKMDLNRFDIGHQYLAFTGVYENELTKEIVKLRAKSGGLMVDVGANYGYYSLIWSSGNAKNKVICFEASPKNLKAISNNIKKNNLDHQITLETSAVSDHIGKIYFDQGPEEQTGWGGISKDKEGNTTVEIETISLDIYFAGDDVNIEVLKIDTEGADFLVIKGSKELLKNKRIQHIFWEENIYRASQLGLLGGEAAILLKELGYAVEQIGDNEYHAFL